MMNLPATPENSTKKSKKLYWILGGVAFLGLGCCILPASLLGLFGLGIHQNEIEKDQKVQEQPTIRVDTNDLVSAYRANAASANDKYKDKVVQIDGSIEKINEDYLVLKSNNGFVSGSFDLLSVDIHFKDDKVLSSLSKGQRITVKGICTGKGLLDSINIENSVVVK